MKTTKNLSVSGLQRSFDTKTYSYQGWSGRVRVVAGDPFYDDYCKWNSDGSAFKHEYGDINLKDGK